MVKKAKEIISPNSQNQEEGDCSGLPAPVDAGRFRFEFCDSAQETDPLWIKEPGRKFLILADRVAASKKQWPVLTALPAAADPLLASEGSKV